MSDFILEYECLESIVHYSKALGKRAEEYSEGLESKIINGIGNVTVGSSGYLTQAADSVRDKISALKQKSDAFGSFAEEVTNLLEVAEQMDQEVADAIAGQGEYSLEHHKSSWFEEWKAKLLNILSDTKNALLLVGTVLLLKLANEYESLENTIKKWYENAKKEVKEIWDKIELANTVLSLSELAVIAFIDVKTARLLKDLGLNFPIPDYTGLNKSGKDGNLDLISVIQKMYEIYSRNVNDFMVGGAVSIDNNIYFGSLQKSSGFDEALQPDTSAFQWGKAITDAALLVAGAAGFVIGGLGEAGGVALDATGIGAAIGIPLSVESAVLMGAGGTLAINSSRNLVNDGFNLMSGEGKASNEEVGKIKGNWQKHLTEAEGFSKRNGVKGAHTQEAFDKYFKDQDLKYKVTESTDHPTIEGIKDITYQVQSKDYKGLPIEGQYNATEFKKTIIDTSKIATETINQWADEAIKNGSQTTLLNNNVYFKGTANNGLKFEGWINPTTNLFDSLYPVLEWSN